ncbi:hypothetical protein [Leuconostoc mesenteroides]
MKKWEDNVQEKAQNLWENHKVALLVFILVFPLVIQIIFSVFNIIAEMELWSFRFPDSSNWIGFWGSYLGFIPSGLIAFLVAKQQIDSENKLNVLRRSESIKLSDLNSLYDILLEMADWKNTLGLINYSEKLVREGGKHLSKKVVLDLYSGEIETKKSKNNLTYILKNYAKRFSEKSDVNKNLTTFSENYLAITVDMHLMKASMTDDNEISFDDKRLMNLIETSIETEELYEKLIDSILSEVNAISNA